MAELKVALKVEFNDKAKAEWCTLEAAEGRCAVVRRGDKTTAVDYTQIKDELVFFAETANSRMMVCVPNGKA